jgi:UDPglucose 6-dehydrogenase
MKIAIVGAGYVGLVVGTGFAESGHLVTCIDRDTARIEPLSQGKLPLYEPGLEELVVRNFEEERLAFTTDLPEGLKGRVLIFVCVNTPTGEDGVPDISRVLEAAESIGTALTGYGIIVVKSTCPVGTTERVREIVAGLTEHPFDVVANPEFLREGAAIDDFMRPDRVVVGCEDVRVLEIMRELYAPFLRTGKPFLAMTIRSAELTKYAVNVMLAARISLINELANIAGAHGADITEVREAVMADGRLGSTYMFPGIGFGGSCLPKDVLAAAQMAREKHVPCPVLEGISATNQAQRAAFVKQIVAYYGDAICEKRIAVWGAAFKPRTDDIRDAPALSVIDGLLDAGAEVVVYDPVAGANIAAAYGDRVAIVPKMYACIDGADGLAIVTEWREFNYPDFEKMAEVMREKVVFDGRNLYSPKVMAEHGFRYFSAGRSSV